jgi:DNA-binding transcriptional ArsR family regulator
MPWLASTPKGSRALITIPLSTEDLTKVRIAPSPLWETVASFGALLHQGRDSVHASWLSRARRALAGADLSALAAAMCVANHYPDFLSPRPTPASATFAEELERLRCTPPEVVFDQVSCLVWQEKDILGRLRPEQEVLLGGLLADPEGAVGRLADALGRYHELAIAPYWPAIREHLEGELIRRGRTLALGGVEMLLFDLDPKLAYGENTVRLEMPYEATLGAAGQGLTLVPSVFSWPTVSVLAHPHSEPTVAYAARGIAKLWTSGLSANGTVLGTALGPGRASALKGCLMPRTTTELARELGLSPAAVSAHLSRLKSAGLLEPHRSGRRVYYRLSGAGEALLEVFGETV